MIKRAEERKSRSAEVERRTTAAGGRSSGLYSLLLLACGLLLLPGCTAGDKMYKESRVLMDTYCTITVVSTSRDRAQHAIDEGFAEIKKLEVLLNYFSPDSEITAVNKAAGIKAVRVSKETLEIMERSKEISQATGGAFDPTLAPVISLWKFSRDPSASAVPSPEAVRKTLRLADFRRIAIDGSTSEIMLGEQGMEVDLGGIAKGFAADKAVEAIQALGIKAALVAIAGDIRGYGRNLSGEGWNVGIQDPRPEAETDKPWEEIFAVLHLNDEAISTSGDYQRFFFKDGRRYHHILDPESGYPADSGLISVSVIAPDVSSSSF